MIVYFVVVLFVGFYLAASPHLYINGFLKLLPSNKRARAREVLFTIGETLQRWLLGRPILMVTNGILTAIGLALLGVPLAVPLGIIAGLLNFIPNLGPIIAGVPAVLIAFVQSPDLALYVLLILHRLPNAGRLRVHSSGSEANHLDAARTHDHGSGFIRRPSGQRRRARGGSATGSGDGDDQNALRSKMCLAVKQNGAKPDVESESHPLSLLFWQLNPESASLAGFRLDADSATDAFCGFVHNRQPYSSSMIGVRGVQLLENFKDFLMIFRRNADAVIFDPKSHRVFLVFTPNFNFWCDVWRDVFQSVA